MAVYPDREHFIPLRASELIDALCARSGPVRTGRLRPRSRLLAGRAAALKDDYAPFDPDADTKRLRTGSDAGRAMA